MGEFSALTQKHILNRFIKFVLWNKLIGTLYFDFLKKFDFLRFWLNIVYQKNKNFKKWEKMNFDGLFELAIDISVGIEYLNVKIG